MLKKNVAYGLISFCLVLLLCFQVMQEFYSVEFSWVYPIIYLMVMFLSLTHYLSRKTWLLGVDKCVGFWALWGVVMLIALFLRSYYSLPVSDVFPSFIGFFSIVLMSVVIAMVLGERALAVFAVLFVVLGLVVAGFVVIGSVRSNGLYVRMYSGVGNYLFPGMYMSAAFSVLLGWVISSEMLANRIHRAVIYFFLLALFIGIALSLSRTALIAACASILFAVFVTVKKKGVTKRLVLWLMVIPLFAPLVLMIMPPRTIERFERMFVSSGYLDNRADVWAESYNLIINRPVFGYGIDRMGLLGMPHNMFMQFWLDGGVYMVVCSVLFFIGPLRKGMVLLMGRYRVSWVLYSYSFAYFVLLVEFNKSHDPYSGFILYIFLGMLMAALRLSKKGVMVGCEV